MVRPVDETVFNDLFQPSNESHKGENGRLLVVGGSELFHASIFWSAQVASKIVDLVHFSSPANENNELVRQKLKEGFWEGIVVDFSEIEDYIEEDDCVLIGPGMIRRETPEAPNAKHQETNMDKAARNDDTAAIVNTLLSKYPNKRWVVDGGALQEVKPELINGKVIITPHRGEWERLTNKTQDSRFKIQEWGDVEERAAALVAFSQARGGVTILAKGRVDVVCSGNEWVVVEGGNAGMSKGGTGDVLAGLAAALYCRNDAYLAARVASLVNKKAGEALYERVGVYFNAGDLVDEVPKIMKKYIS